MNATTNTHALPPSEQPAIPPAEQPSRERQGERMMLVPYSELSKLQLKFFCVATTLREWHMTDLDELITDFASELTEMGTEVPR
ncbi:MAG: hypothetical protein KC731_24450 [Myxococcales bacterium]|nr:hypothetical protein [Myxococcales bacterium]